MRDRNLLLAPLVAIGCVAVSIVAASCGAKDQRALTLTTPNVISASEVSHAAPGSPDRALLSWFQAVQFRDVAAVNKLTAPASLTGVTARKLDREVGIVGASLARPQIVSTRITGQRAFVRVLLLTYVGASKPLVATPAGFKMAERGGSWVMTNVLVLFPHGVAALTRKKAVRARSNSTTTPTSTTTPLPSTATTTAGP